MHRRRRGVGGVIHHGGFLGYLHVKYAYSPRAACTSSYRNSSILKRIRCHGARPCKRGAKRQDGGVEG